MSAVRVRRRSAEIADPLAQLRQTASVTAETVERAQQAADDSIELAIDGYAP